MEKQQPFQMAELANRVVAGPRGLRALEPLYSHADVRGRDHIHVVRAVADR